MHPRRLWSIVLHQHEDASYTARVSVDGKVLLPECVACAGEAAIAYIVAALVDARLEDQLMLRAQGSGAIRTWRAKDAASAARWLSEQMPSLSAATCSDGAKSGTRPIVPGAQSTAPDARRREG